MTAFSMFLTVVACKHCYSAKQLPIVDPEGQAHLIQLLIVNLEQVKVQIISAAGEYSVDPNWTYCMLYKYSVYTSYWIFAKKNIDSLPYCAQQLSRGQGCLQTKIVQKVQKLFTQLEIQTRYGTDLRPVSNNSSNSHSMNALHRCGLTFRNRTNRSCRT